MPFYISFINTDTFALYNYFQMKEHSFFESYTGGWPGDHSDESVDILLATLEAPFSRFWDDYQSAAQVPHDPWEIAEKTPSPGHYFIDSGDGNKYKQHWTVRNMTQPELDAVNELAHFEVSNLRALRYIQESDPLFFKAFRQEITMQGWLDQVNLIKSELPYPALIELPE
jgi:hypothetical protein